MTKTSQDEIAELFVRATVFAETIHSAACDGQNARLKRKDQRRLARQIGEAAKALSVITRTIQSALWSSQLLKGIARYPKRKAQQ